MTISGGVRPLRYIEIVLTRLITAGIKMQTHVRRFIISIMVNAIMWGLIFWFFFAFIF